MFFRISPGPNRMTTHHPQTTSFTVFNVGCEPLSQVIHEKKPAGTMFFHNFLALGQSHRACNIDSQEIPHIL